MPVQSADRSTNNLITAPDSHKSWYLPVVFLLVMLIALAVAYQPVLFNFFTSDDFYIISWLDSIKHNPGALFQGVYEGTPYYRPLTNLFWFGEYLLFGTNSCIFRIVAISLKIISAIVFAFLLYALGQDFDDHEKRTGSPIKWSLFSASLFLVYPLHTEPINWFVCTTEVLVNLFILSSFLLYLYWRKIGNFSLAIASCTLGICAFLTKEVAVTLPLLFTAYELALSKFNTNATSKQRNQSLATLSKLSYTAPYWLLLGGYLIIRRLITGNFLGNWTNNVFHFTNNQSMVKAWLHSLKVMVIPLSSAMFEQQKYAYYFCWAILVGLLSISIYKMRNNSYSIRLGIFLVTWFFVCLLPMLKLFLITPDLLDARYGYIASVPLCAFLMFGLSRIGNNKFSNYLQYSLLAFSLAFFTFILRGNNLAWAETGELTNCLRNDFARIHNEIGGDPKIYFFNIPLQNKGVPVDGIKTIQSMNHIPFSKTNFYNGLWLLNNDQSLPIGIMKCTLEKEKTGYYIYCWSAQDKHFHRINLVKQIGQITQTKPNKTLSIKLNGNTQDLQILQNFGLSYETSKRKMSFVFHPHNLVSWPVDLLVLRVHKDHSSKTTDPIIASVEFTNNARLQLDDSDILNKRLIYLEPEQDQLVFIPVRGIPAWSFGGTCQTLRVSFPTGTHLSVSDAYAASIENLIPKIYLNDSRGEGGLDLNSRNPKRTITYDASSINNCAGVAVEIINDSENFEELNSPRPQYSALGHSILMHPKGQIIFDQNMFPNEGLFKVRLRPIDKNGKQTSFCSDHFTVSISK